MREVIFPVLGVKMKLVNMLFLMTQSSLSAVALLASLYHCTLCCPWPYRVHLILSSPAVVIRWTQAAVNEMVKETERQWQGMKQKSWGRRRWGEEGNVWSFFAEVHHNPVECTCLSWMRGTRHRRYCELAATGQHEGKPKGKAAVAKRRLGAPEVITVVELNDPRQGSACESFICSWIL